MTTGIRSVAQYIGGWYPRSSAGASCAPLVVNTGYRQVDPLTRPRVEHLGFDEAWIGEHHSRGAEIGPSPEVFIAAAAAERMEQIRFGTGVVSLPSHHPLITVDRIMQLDLQTRGRVVFETGPGKIPLDTHMMGIDPRGQRRRQGEAREVILPLLRGEIVSMETDWFTLRDAHAQFPTYYSAGIEVVTASTISPNGSVLAGTNGRSLLSLAASSPSCFDALDRNWSIHEEVSAEYGHVVDRSTWWVVNPIFLAETQADAERAVSRRIQSMACYANRQNGRYPEWGQTPQGVIDHWRHEVLGEFGQAIIGTPDQAIVQIERLIEKTGGFGTLLILHVDMANWEDTKRSFELFASEVVPHFRRRNVRRQASLQFAEDNREYLIGALEKVRTDYYGRPEQTTA